MTLSMQDREAEMTTCTNCGAMCLTVIFIEGRPFCNPVCYSEWKWKQEKKESQDMVGRRRRRPTLHSNIRRSVKKNE